MSQITNFIIDNHWFIVFIIFLCALFIQLVYYFGFYFRFIFYRNKPSENSSEPVSVIICARNEAENLDNYLPLVLTQDYPNYEIIVVDDCSTDETENVLRKYTKQYPILRTSAIKEDKKFSHGKKLAITIGIKAAKNERLLFIDADCKPESNQWLRRMTSHFTDKTSIILGYGGYYSQPGLLNKYIRYDALIIALHYFSFALNHIPYMGVGRNLAYKRSLFYSGKGFSNHYHLASGDDDLFVNEHASKSNTAIEVSVESHTRTAAKQSFNKWTFQKRRHMSTGRMYKPGHKFLLGLEPFSRLIYYVSFVFLLFIPEYSDLVLIAFGFRFLIQLFVIKKTMIHLKEKNLLIISSVFDVFSLFINFGLYVSSRFRPVVRQWK